MFYFLNSNIKFLRKQHGFTQPELAKKVDISKSSLANIESDLRNVSIEVLDRLHSVFNITLDDLVYKDLTKASDKTI